MRLNGLCIHSQNALGPGYLEVLLVVSDRANTCGQLREILQHLHPKKRDPQYLTTSASLEPEHHLISANSDSVSKPSDSCESNTEVLEPSAHPFLYFDLGHDDILESLITHRQESRARNLARDCLRKHHSRKPWVAGLEPAQLLVSPSIRSREGLLLAARSSRADVLDNSDGRSPYNEWRASNARGTEVVMQPPTMSIGFDDFLKGYRSLSDASELKAAKPINGYTEIAILFEISTFYWLEMAMHYLQKRQDPPRSI
ncbi:hypothetical protein AC578_832 [Pseudocercospora eumusae]|uniref:Uncharacterized protein n=1 Tax=Pseudocercospora eumusae TaxID=321146 RepID=A0A139GZP7_9PEZI|nr:hypothetical protein AC578_832 [Pseudocercospora eumusae]